MPPSPPYAVLYVDPDYQHLQRFRHCFSDDFWLLTATNAWDGYQLLAEHGSKVGVLITEQRLPDETGTVLLEKAGQLHPSLIRLLTTSCTEFQTAVDAINCGRAYAFFHSLWDETELREVLHKAMNCYTLQMERETLLLEKKQIMHRSAMEHRILSLQTLAEGLNHHLRNALTTVRAFIEVAPQKHLEERNGNAPVDTVFWHEWQDQALAQTDHIQKLLHQLSDATHTAPIQRSDYISLPHFLEEVIEPYIEALISKDLHLNIEMDEDLPGLMVNRAKFTEFWQRLLTQATQDLSKGQTMCIDASLDNSQSLGGELVLTIRDDAHWPPHANAANLFDPFFVRSDKPTELGINMAACFVIIHLHGGYIQAKTREPIGIEMEIRIPIHPPDPESEQKFSQHLQKHLTQWQARELIGLYQI